jgi:hypothetical protein
VHSDLATSVQDPEPATADLDHHTLADQPPRHAVGVAIDLDAAVGLDPADEFADRSASGCSALASSRWNRTIGGSPVVPWIRMFATSRVHCSRWASNAAQLANSRPAIALLLT